MSPNDPAFRTLPPAEPTAAGPGETPPSTPTEATASGGLKASSSDPTPANIRPLGTPLPEVFGRYRIDKQLGRGGMGAVYLARDTLLGDRPVALKVPLIHLEEHSTFWERFQREARAAAALNHPHICPVYDVGVIDGVPFLALAYIEGQSLSQRLRTGPPLAPDEAARLVRTLARTLEEAHQHGIVHRDLKPGNVIINQRGDPVIMDFGLAWVDKGDASRLTQTGEVIGTPAYMPPEQVSGDTKLMGPRSDIYSLGVILYELLTGKVPFAGNSAVVLARVLTEEPAPPSSHRPDLDRRLEAICLKAMAKRVSERYGSMKEFAAALEEYLGQSAASASPSATLVQPVVVVPRRPRSVGRWLAAVLAAGVLAGLAGLGWHYRGELEALLERRAKEPTATVASKSLVEDTPRVVPTQVVKPPPKLPPAPPVVVPAPGLLRVLTGSNAMVSSLTFSPDGRHLLAGTGGKSSQAGTLSLWDLQDGKEVSRLDRVAGKWVPLKGVEKVGFSAGGTRAWCITWDVALWLWDVQGKEAPYRAAGGGSVIIPDAALLPDGKFLLYAEPILEAGKLHHRLRLAALFNPGRPAGTLEGQGDEMVNCLAVAPDGRHALTGVGNGGVILWDLLERKHKARHDRLRGEVLAVAFPADGLTMLAGSTLGDVQARETATGKVLFHQRGPADQVPITTRVLAFSADGRRVIAATGPPSGQPGDHLVWIWDAASGRLLHRFTGHSDTIRCAALSADGRYAASGGDDKTIRLWRLGE